MADSVLAMSGIISPYDLMGKLAPRCLPDTQFVSQMSYEGYHTPHFPTTQSRFSAAILRLGALGSVCTAGVL